MFHVIIAERVVLPKQGGLIGTVIVSEVENQLARIQRHERQSWTAILTGLQMLERHGLDPNLNKFKRLRHVPGGSLWELRAQGRPAYRVLFAPIAPDVYLLLDVVRKDDFSKDSSRYVRAAVERLQSWRRSARE